MNKDITKLREEAKILLPEILHLLLTVNKAERDYLTYKKGVFDL